MLKGAWAFVAVIYCGLAMAFLAPLAALLHEFGWQRGSALALFECNHFIFFPVFGVLALIAFYIPSVAFTDLYWRRNGIWAGGFRFSGGFVLLTVGAYVAAQSMLDAGPRSIWEIAPAAIDADRGEPADCHGGQNAVTALQCRRAPLLKTVLAVREASQTRIGLAKFARDCNPDQLLPLGAAYYEQRYCFVAERMLDAGDCCMAQRRFAQALDSMFSDTSKWSLTYRVHAATMPCKVFFLLVVLVIGALLAARSAKLDMLYGGRIRQIERGVLVGAAAMLFWPMTYFASSQSWSVLYGLNLDAAAVRSVMPFGDLTGPIDGSIRRNLALAYTLALGPWALMLLFYFFRRKGMEGAARVGGVAASFLAVLQHEEIIDYSVRALGSGASVKAVVPLLALLLLVGLGIVYSPWLEDRGRRRPRLPGDVT